MKDLEASGLTHTGGGGVDPAQARVYYRRVSDEKAPEVRVILPDDAPFRACRKGKSDRRSKSFDKEGNPVYQVRLLHALKTGRREDRSKALESIPLEAWPGNFTAFNAQTFDLIALYSISIRDFRTFVGGFIARSASKKKGLDDWCLWENVAEDGEPEESRARKHVARPGHEPFPPRRLDTPRAPGSWAHGGCVTTSFPVEETMPPKPLTKDESLSGKTSAKGLAVDVAEAILAQFSVRHPWIEPTPPSPEPVDLIVIAAALAAAARQPVDSSHLEAALPLWQESWRLIYFQGIVEKRKAALDKLIFSGKGLVTLNEFLLKLLPKDEPAKRQQHLEEALLRTQTNIAELFQRGAKGWPREEASRLLADGDATGVAVRDLFHSQVDKLGGVTLELAVTYAPLILGWREFKSSPRARGSWGRQIRSGSGTPAADG